MTMPSTNTKHLSTTGITSASYAASELEPPPACGAVMLQPATARLAASGAASAAGAAAAAAPAVAAGCGAADGGALPAGCPLSRAWRQSSDVPALESIELSDTLEC